MIRTVFSLASITALGAFGYDCKSGSKNDPPPPPPPSAASTEITTPPPAMPIAEFDASIEALEGKTPLESAHIYVDRGQFWMAQMSLEKKALGPSGTKAEAEYLGYICFMRDEPDCIAKCEAKLGKKLKFDGGVAAAPASARVHEEPKNDLADARDHVLKKEYKEAHDILMPKVVDGKASKEEIRVLKQACQGEGDRVCIALCDAKLK